MQSGDSPTRTPATSATLPRTGGRTGWPATTRLAVLSLFLLACGGSDGDTEPGPPILELTPDNTLLVEVGSSTTLSLATSGGMDVPGSQATWTSDDDAIVSVSGSGRVTAVSVGTTTIRAEWEGGEATARVEVWIPVEVDPSAAGTQFVGRQDYILYIPGALPLILTAPHGGPLEPSEIPDRTFGVTVTDRNTLELTLAIRDSLLARTGHAPHVILSRLDRIKLDPNREIVEAAQGDPFAENAWHEFQGWTAEARAFVQQEFGAGFYVDIHGHGHPVDRVELGYLISSGQLTATDEVLDASALHTTSSIRSLVETSPLPFSDLLRGPTSVGGLLGDEGVRSVPSPDDPDPGGNPYFTGGHNTRQHGSRDGGTVDGVQFEHHFPGLRDTEANRAEYAGDFARAIQAFMLEHYGFFAPAPPTGAGSVWTDGDRKGTFRPSTTPRLPTRRDGDPTEP